MQRCHLISMPSKNLKCKKMGLSRDGPALKCSPQQRLRPANGCARQMGPTGPTLTRYLLRATTSPQAEPMYQVSASGHLHNKWLGTKGDVLDMQRARRAICKTAKSTYKYDCRCSTRRVPPSLRIVLYGLQWTRRRLAMYWKFAFVDR